MRVLLASDVFPPRCGGSGWSTYYLAKGLLQRGHQVKVAVPRTGGQARSGSHYLGVEVEEFEYRAPDIPFLRAVFKGPAFYPAFSAFLGGLAGRWKPDVIHGQHSMTVPPAVLAARRRGLPVVSTVRDFWPVCLFGTMTKGEGVCTGCSAPGALGCVWDRHGAKGLPGTFLLPVLNAGLRYKVRCLASSSKVTAVSDYVAGALSGIVPRERLVVVPNSVDAEQVQRIIASPPHYGIQGRYLLFAGKLESNKGAGQLLPLLERLRPGMPTIVLGDGSLEEEMKRSAARSGLDVRFAGWVENDEVLRLMARSELLLFPSAWPEPLSRVLLEAMAVGVPVVAINTGGTGDIIENGMNGLLANDSGEFVSQVALALADSALRERMATRAREVASERFSTRAVAAQMEMLYQELAAA
ncbi:MAG: glycosyltransferase family 4 protein [Chloroflexi bacterium]|nr:glycosyltransferase family 4 protein [Chloroflexota bacterium]